LRGQSACAQAGLLSRGCAQRLAGGRRRHRGAAQLLDRGVVDGSDVLPHFGHVDTLALHHLELLDLLLRGLLLLEAVEDKHDGDNNDHQHQTRQH
jgi:hypothetical protein